MKMVMRILFLPGKSQIKTIKCTISESMCWTWGHSVSESWNWSGFRSLSWGESFFKSIRFRQ